MFWSWEDVKLNRPDLDYGFIFCFCFVFVFRFVLSVTKGEHTSYGRPFPHERGVYRVVHCPFGDIVNHWGGGHLRAFYFWFVARRVCVFLIFNFSELVVDTSLGVPFEDISVRLFIKFCPFGDKRDSTLPGGGGGLCMKGH